MLEFVYTVAMLIFCIWGHFINSLAETSLHTIKWSNEVISIYYILWSAFFSPNAVKNKGDLTSDDPISDAVETTVAEPVLTDCKESKEG